MITMAVIGAATLPDGGMKTHLAGIHIVHGYGLMVHAITLCQMDIWLQASTWMATGSMQAVHVNKKY